MPMLARARDLRAVGLSWEAIASVIRLDYGAGPSSHTLRAYLSDGRKATATLTRDVGRNLPEREAA